MTDHPWDELGRPDDNGCEGQQEVTPSADEYEVPIVISSKTADLLENLADTLDGTKGTFASARTSVDDARATIGELTGASETLGADLARGRDLLGRRRGPGDPRGRAGHALGARGQADGASRRPGNIQRGDEPGGRGGVPRGRRGGVPAPHNKNATISWGFSLQAAPHVL